MRQKRIGLTYKNKKFKLNLKVCNWFEKFLGLMFVKKEKAKALLFEFKKPKKRCIHSYFVFIRFVAVWIDDKGKIIELKTIKPFTLFICPKKPFSKLIEIPINNKYSKIIRLLVGD